MRERMVLRRPNDDMAMVVDRGILLNAEHGRDKAVAYLEREHVPLTVIARVLSEPSRRRSAATPDL